MVADNSESAFPRDVGIGAAARHHTGLTARQWYAGHAMLVAGVLCQDKQQPTPEEIARLAFSIADAMLAEGNA